MMILLIKSLVAYM
jgi:hypothetical protein